MTDGVVFAQSMTVRALVYSRWTIERVTASLEGSTLSMQPDSRSGTRGLYAASFDMGKIGPGLHLLAVSARDARGNERTQTIQFSTDGSRAELRRTAANFLQRIPATEVLRWTFAFVAVLVAAFVLAPKAVAHCAFSFCGFVTTGHCA